VLTSTFKLMLNAGMEKATTTFYHGQWDNCCSFTLYLQPILEHPIRALSWLLRSEPLDAPQTFCRANIESSENLRVSPVGASRTKTPKTKIFLWLISFSILIWISLKVLNYD
jgi:hypothetical protein